MRNTIAIIIVLVSLVSFSCQNEVDKFVPREFIAPGDYKDVLEIIQNLDEQHTIKAEDGGVVSLKNSTITIVPNAFIRNGQIVTGNVKIKTVEILAHSDIVRYDVATVNESDELLEAQGVWRIEAYQNDEKLSLRAIPDAIVVHTFSDQPKTADGYVLEDDGAVRYWSKNNSSVVNGSISTIYKGVVLDTTGYRISVQALSWIGIHQLSDPSSFSNLCLDLLDSNTPENSIGFLCYDAIRSCQRLAISNTLDCGMTTVMSINTAKIIVLAHKGDLGGQNHIEAEVDLVNLSQSNVEVSMTPQLISEATLLDVVDGF